MKAAITSLLLILPLGASENLVSGFPGSFRPTKRWQLADSATAVEGKTELILKAAEDGKPALLVNGRNKAERAPYLFSAEEFGDCRLHIEFMIPKGSNAGLYFMGRYEVQILDSFGKEKPYFGDLGGIYQRWNPKAEEKKRGFEGTAPKLNAARKPGEWQTIDVSFRAPRFDSDGNKTENARFLTVHVNGQLVQENVEVTGPTRAHPLKGETTKGPLSIQGDHGPIAIRSLSIGPLE